MTEINLVYKNSLKMSLFLESWIKGGEEGEKGRGGGGKGKEKEGVYQPFLNDDQFLQKCSI